MVKKIRVSCALNAPISIIAVMAEARCHYPSHLPPPPTPPHPTPHPHTAASANKKTKQPQKSSTSTVTAKPVGEQEEEEWDGEDSSEESGDDDSDASGDDDDEEDEEEDDDEEDDDDEESYDSNKKSSKRKQPQKTSRAPKAPRTSAATSHAPATTQKPSKAATFVTPAPHTAATPSTQMNDIFGLCHASATAANTPSAVNSSGFKPQPILAEGVCGMGHHDHDKMTFLMPEHRLDSKGRPMTHPDYNPRTLRVPDKVLKEATPAMAQWWKLKADNMDTVLFFKVGKFYELFHMDADVGMKELDLIYMKGEKAHSGFPEVSYGKFSSILVSKGYRVARVEQTETPEMLKERNDSKSGTKDKVVAREMCSIMSKGTRTYCHLDDLSLLDQGPSAGSSVLFCIKEVAVAATEEEAGAGVGPGVAAQYGICSVDCVLGSVTLALFEDDKQRTRLRTMLSKFSPNEVVLEKAAYSAETLGAVRLIAPHAKMEILQPTEVWTNEQTVAALQKNKYFASEDAYPAVLRAVLQCMNAPTSTHVLVSALGGAMWQLSRSLIDYEIISMGRFCGYVPPDLEVSDDAAGGGDAALAALSSQQVQLLNLGGAGEVEAAAGAGADVDSSSSSSSSQQQQTMTLDAVSLANLEILVNNFDRTEKGSLWAFMDKCKTPFGRRLLHEWIVRPLYRPVDIQRRAHAVEELLSARNIEANACRQALGKVPDLERLLSRVHSNGLKRKGNNHPEQRAIMYEAPIYNARKIKDFADILTGFELLVGVVGQFNNNPSLTIESALLRRAVKPPGDDQADKAGNGGKFPLAEVKQLLRHFRDIFDEKQAKKEGNIKPRPGVSKEYDDATADMAELHVWFETYLRDQKQATGINSLQYWGTGKDRYQMEVPMDKCSKVPSNWESKSQKKTHRRYWTPKVQAKLAELTEAEGRMDAAQKDTLRAIFAKFDDSHAVWSVAVACVALLDALLSLAFISSLPNYCWPDIRRAEAGNGVDAAPSAELRIVAGRHPMLEHTLSNQSSDAEYIANSLHLGGLLNTDAKRSLLNPRLMLLSGPNMGGKSTLLRQTCLIAIMAQMGCKVPAESVCMTPVDRIFTRVGASDRILAGQSTFFVELAETATILKLATKVRDGQEEE